MKSASTEYKEIMNRMVRNRGYITVSVGIVNQEAQDDSRIVGDSYTEWSDKRFPFANGMENTRYATMEQNLVKADGNMVFLPENGRYEESGVTTDAILGTILVEFGNIYSIKGLTLVFDETCYPTSFTVVTDSKTLTYTNDSVEFTTTDVLGNTTKLEIIPTAMVGGQQRLRLNEITMGIGLVFTNREVENMSYSESCDGVSEELPSANLSVKLFDENNLFNIDDDNSFINFLEIGQKISVSIGIEHDDEIKEYIPLNTLRLSDWQSTKGKMSFTAKDLVAMMKEKYVAGNTIHTRTLYADAEAVLQDLGLEPDEYEIDECLRDITVSNPLPECSHAECLQLISNAGRCIFYQRYDGIMVIKANFANVIEPRDIGVSTDSQSQWSHYENVTKGSEYVYSDMTSNFMSTDGSMYFMPENGEDYLQTSFVSAEISDDNGRFTKNPNISLQLEAGYVYYSLIVKFDGTVPKKIVIHTTLNGTSVEDVEFSDLAKKSTLSHEFKRFDNLKIEVVETEPHSRVLINEITFGDLSDYYLTRHNMTEEPVGYKEQTPRYVDVRVFSFEIDQYTKKPKEVEDEVYERFNCNPTGNPIVFENQLIGTHEHAQMIAEWLGNHYKNNTTYSVDYRGEPRLNASDIIFMESETVNNLQCEIEKLKLSFNGSFKGSLELRKALNMVEV